MSPSRLIPQAGLTSPLSPFFLLEPSSPDAAWSSPSRHSRSPPLPPWIPHRLDQYPADSNLGPNRSGGSPSAVMEGSSPAAAVLAQPCPGEPELACYCWEHARRLTSRTPRNPLRIFLMCRRKFHDGQGCKLWIWEDVLRSYVPAMVLHYAGSATNNMLVEEISSARQLIAQKEKQIEDLVQMQLQLSLHCFCHMLGILIMNAIATQSSLEQSQLLDDSKY